MKELRPLLHDLFNALAIAQGMAESLKEGMTGAVEMSSEQQLQKLEKSIKAMLRVEQIANNLKAEIQKLDSEF
jgi:hypothetical protein